MDRYRDHSNVVAVGVFAGLITAGVAAWGTFLWAFVTLL